MAQPLTSSQRYASERQREKYVDPLSAPRGPAMVQGALLGALGGVAFAGWEAAVVGWANLPLPAPDIAPQILATYAVVGAVLGGIAGIPGFVGTRWAAMATILGAGWVAAGPAAVYFAGQGGLPHLGLLAALGLAGAIGGTVAQLTPSGAVLGGMSVALFVTVALAGPANVHLMGSPLSWLSLLIDVLVLVVALFLAMVSTVFVGDGRLPRVIVGITALGAIGWGAHLARPVTVGAPPQATADAKPPIVLVVVDGLRADHLRTYGYDRRTAPNLEALAARGLVFADATAAAPWTLPSMASLLTGLPPTRHGAGLNLGSGTMYAPLRGGVPTLPQRLREAGYVTGAVVTSPLLGASYGFHRGFDAYDDRTGPTTVPLAMWPLIAIYVSPVPWTDYRQAADVTDSALAFVAAQPHRQWFLMVHYMDVHGPFRPDQEDVDALGDGPGPDLVDVYDASIHEVDRHLGRLLDGLPKDAIVVVTADHGDQLLETRLQANASVGNERHGHSLHQEALRVPLIVAGPGVQVGRSSRMVSLVDVTPTLLAIGGAEPVETSGWALGEITGTDVPPDRAVIAEAVRWGPETQMARIGPVKLVRRVDDSWLYDLSQDPFEAAPLTGTTDVDLVNASTLAGRLTQIGAASTTASPSLGADVADLVERVR